MSYLQNPNYCRGHNNQGRRHSDRSETEEDYCSYVTRLEKKTSMAEGPHFGNMQHAFKRGEVYEEEEEKEESFEASGRFGRAKHMGRPNNKGRHHHNGYDEAVNTEKVEFLEQKQDHEYLVRAA